MKIWGDMVKYIIGIDGGGTQTVGYLADEDQRLLQKEKVGPTNYHSVGIKKVKKNLKILIEKLCEKSNIEVDDVAIISSGIAGVDRPEDKTLIRNVLRQFEYDFDIIVNNDVKTALINAHGQQKGIMLVCGTGSIAAGVKGKNNFVRVGGWGHLIGDEGSGYKIAIYMLQKIMESFDGREKFTLLSDLVLKELGLEEPLEIIDYVYNPEISKENIADLTPLVFKAIRAGDEIARKIVEQATDELLEMVITVIRKLKMNEKERIISLSGGVFENSRIMRETFIKKAKKEIPSITFREPKFPPGIGALIIGWNELNIEHDEEYLFSQLENIKISQA